MDLLVKPDQDAESSMTPDEYATAIQGRHIIQYDRDGMTVMHPLACRPNLFDCPVWVDARKDVLIPPSVLGRYYCGLDKNGNFEQYEKVED